MKDFKAISEVAFSVGITRKEYANILHISASSLYRYLREPQKVSVMCQAGSVVIYNVINKGISTFGDKSKFSHWLFCKNIALGGPKPIEMLSTDEGTKQVDFCLNRIEWGVFA
nr:antitoxin Xre/MbcA/ParS toxin-binding domain-containing protein [uncultured Carboxylicivirga sp.]